MYAPIYPVKNPSDEERHEILRNSLEAAGRPEDYECIIKHLSPPEDITNIVAAGEMHGVKIGIIGGGVAGMAAAYELRKLGADITILEASDDRIGGRVYTYYFDRNKKYYAEFGAYRIPVSHETTWHYINLFNLRTTSLTSPTRNNFLYVHNTRLRTSDSIEQYLYPKYELSPQERATPWDELMDYAFEYQIRQLTPEVRAEMLQILPSYSSEYLPFLTKNLRQYLEDLGFSQGAISLLSGTNPLTGSYLNLSYNEVINEDYTFDYRNIYSIDGGNVNLPMAFYQSFQEKKPSQYRNQPASLLGTVCFQSGRYVTGIYQSAYRDKIVVRYRCKEEVRDFVDIFDYVICALPFSSLREVEIKPFFSNQKMQAIFEYNYLDAMKTAFLCNRRFWERKTDYGNIFGGISFTDLPIQSIFYPVDHVHMPENQLTSPEDPGVLLASYNLYLDAVRLGNLDPLRRYQVIRENVEEVHGLPRGFLNSIVEATKTVHWNAEPNFRGAFASVIPSQKIRFNFCMLQPEFNNRVFFAGEHLSTKHGWLQGALYTGKAAANQLATSFLSNGSSL